ncbi:MAG: hypothetical protein EOM72_10105 [Opitutae bacterium]|nr:hypothetical protein [Opitutae bacterium]
MNKTVRLRIYMRAIVSRIRNIDISIWIALASLLLSIPAIILSVSQWRAQRNYDATKELVEYLGVLEDAINENKMMQDTLTTVNTKNIDPIELSLLRKELEKGAAIYGLFWRSVDSSPKEEIKDSDAANRHLLTGLIRQTSKRTRNLYNRTIYKAHTKIPPTLDTDKPVAGHPPQGVGTPEP